MTVEARDRLRDEVLEALRMVIDPELGESLVDLGLIYGIDVDEQGRMRIAMSTTTKGCPATAYLKDAVHSAASFVPGVEGVEVLLTYDPPWSPDMIDASIRQVFRSAGGR